MTRTSLNAQLSSASAWSIPDRKFKCIEPEHGTCTVII